MTESIRRMLWERRLLANREAYAQHMAHVREVIGAFEEGLQWGIGGPQPWWGTADPERAWLESKTRARVYGVPSAPFSLAPLLCPRGHPVDWERRRYATKSC